MTSNLVTDVRRAAPSLVRICVLLPLATSQAMAQAPSGAVPGSDGTSPSSSAAPVAPQPSAPQPSAPQPSTDAPSVSPDESDSPAPSPGATNDSAKPSDPAAPPSTTAPVESLAPVVSDPPATPAPRPKGASLDTRSPRASASASADLVPATPNAYTPNSLDGEPLESSHSSQLALDDDGAILTTVDRRTRDAQRVPHSVVVVSGTELTRQGITSIRELTAATPFVEVADHQGSIEIYMRGLGDSDDRGLGDTSVATYVDGVYVPRARGFRPLFFDTERVEIALGPQSTLRGRSAFAGTVHVVNKAAKLGEWGADGSVQLGNYGQRLLRAALNAPVGDRFALRVAVLSERHDPFYENEGGAPLLRAAEDADRWAYRLSGRWEPTDNIAVTVRLDNTKERGTGVVGSNYTELLSRGVAASEVPNPRATAFVGNQPSQSIDHWGVSANVEVDLGRVGLEVLSSYRSLTYNQHVGHNRTNYDGAQTPTLDSYSDSVWNTGSQSAMNEIRAFSSDAARLRWIVGFFHFSESQSVFFGQVNDPASAGRLGQELNLNDVASGSIAGYVDTTTDITDAFTTIAGFRLTSEYRELNGIGGGFTLQCNGEALAEALTNDPSSTCSPPSAATSDGGLRWGTPGFAFKQSARSDYTQGRGANTLDGVRSRVETFRDGVESWGSRDNVTAFLEQPGADVGAEFREQRGKLTAVLPDFRLGGEWDVAPQSSVYLTFSTGHRREGLNARVATPSQAQPPDAYAPSTLYATELGSRNTFFDKRLTLNGAAFWYAQSDTQSAIVREFGASDAVVRSNVGDSRVLGLSIDALGYLPRGFSGKFSAMVMDARYLGATITDPRVAPAPDTTVDIAGNFLPRAPRLTLAYGLAQTIPTDIGDFDWSLSGQTKSPMYMTPFNGDGRDDAGNQVPQLDDVVPWTSRVDAAVGYARSEGDIRFDAFVANLTNASYMTSLFATPSANLRFFNPPRQFGLRISMRL